MRWFCHINGSWITQIRGGVTVPATAEYLHIRDELRDVQLSEAADLLVWRWTVDGTYTSRSGYLALHSALHPIPGCDRIWETWAPLRVKISLWLALRRRHWTADRRRWHGLDALDHCYLCDQEPETIDHIIASCSFSRQVWWNILAVLRANASQIGEDSILAWWNAWRLHWTSNKRKGADSLFALVAWELWTERNARCFRNNASTLPQVLSIVKHVADQWIDAGASNLGCLVRE